MKPVFPTKEIEEENNKLIQMILNEESDTIDFDTFIEKNASSEFKQYMAEESERKRKLWEEEGTLV